MVAQFQASSSSRETRRTDLTDLKWSSVRVDEVVDVNYRLDGGFHGSKGREARRDLQRCKFDVVSLGKNLIENAFHIARFKRIYVDKDNGIPFFLPSQITDIYPKPVKFISPKTKIDIESIRVKHGQILLTCSGSVGAVSYVTKTLDNLAFSHDVIRITASIFPGYVYTYLKSKVGRSLVETNNYGAVVKHIEPHHLNDIPVPDPPYALKEKIHNLVEDSFRLRDESNSLMDEARQLLTASLQLPDIESLKSGAPKFEPSADFLNFSTPVGQLDDRMDGSYHVPVVQTILEHLHKHAREVTTVGDNVMVKSIVLPGRFKRNYVDEENGVVFFGGKQLHQLDPENKKYLSRKTHDELIRQKLRIHTNTILITCSGTIGKVAIVPEHWSNWVPNQHVMRVVPASDQIAGYLYAWLSSDFAFPLITRHAYAAVIDEIDASHVSQICVPLLHDTLVQQRINDKVLEANAKRTRAYQLEQKALKVLNDEVIYSGLRD